MKSAHRKSAKMSPLFDHPNTDQTFGYSASSLLKDETKPNMRRRHTVGYTAQQVSQLADSQVSKPAAVPGAIPTSDRTRLPLTNWQFRRSMKQRGKQMTHLELVDEVDSAVEANGMTDQEI